MSNLKMISVGTLDQLMDLAVGATGGTLNRASLVKVPLTFRAVDLIAGAFARMPVHVWRGETDVTDAELPRYWADLNYRLAASLLIFDQAYALLETNRFGANARWRFLVAPNVTIKTDSASGALRGFTYNGRDIDNYEKRLLWWWWPSITSEVGPGDGPSSAALNDAALAKYLTDYAMAYFQSGGTPTTIAQQSGPVSNDDRERFESWWNALKAGVKRAFRAVLISDKITFSQIGSDIKDTIAPEVYMQSARNVALAYGIPLSLLMSDAANYATALEDHVKFYTETVIPLGERMIEVWNERVYEPQGLEIELVPDELEVMQQYTLQKAQAVAQLVGQPVLTVDEGRELIEYKPMNDASPTAPINEAPAQPQPDAIDSAAAKHWQQYERKAHNALSAGKSPAVPFASDVLLAVEVESVKARLDECKSHDDIAALFSEARRGAYKSRNDVTALIDAINAARAELREAINGRS